MANVGGTVGLGHGRCVLPVSSGSVFACLSFAITVGVFADIDRRMPPKGDASGANFCGDRCCGGHRCENRL